MAVRLIDLEKDYPILCEWWAQHEWSPPPKDILPPNGYIEEGVCAGFLYNMDSKIAMLEWVVSNPNCDKIDRARGVVSVMNRLIRHAQGTGCLVIFTSSNDSAWMNRLESFGFAKGDEGVTQYFMRSK